MDTVRDIYELVLGVLLTLGQTIRVWDVIDVLIITFLIYRVLSFMRKTSASSVMKGLILILVVAWLAFFFDMYVLTYLLRQVLQLGVIVIVVLFQPEIRKLFERMGTSKFTFFFLNRGRHENLETVILSVVAASDAMAKSHTGAIIVFEREVGLNDYAVTGTNVDAQASSELIQNVFYPNSPLHDGALIVREGRLLAAACMLPLSNNINLSRELGMRHRAGVGISERSDALVVIVSEQTGTVSIAVDGMLKRHLSSDTVEKLLRKELTHGGNTKPAKVKKAKKQPKQPKGQGRDKAPSDQEDGSYE